MSDQTDMLTDPLQERPHDEAVTNNELSTYEIPASPEAIAELRALWIEIRTRMDYVAPIGADGKPQGVDGIQERIRKHSYVLALGPEEVIQYTNVFGLIYYLNQVTINVINELIAFVDDPANASRLTEGTVNKMLAAKIASFTPNILAPGYLDNQSNDEFYPGSLQRNPDVVGEALRVSLRFMRRQPNTVMDMVSNEDIFRLIDPTTGAEALKNITGTVNNYINAYTGLGHTDLDKLQEITDTLAMYFANLTSLADKTMYGVAQDLYNNIYSLVSGVLGIMSADVQAKADRDRGFTGFDETPSDIES